MHGCTIYTYLAIGLVTSATFHCYHGRELSSILKPWQPVLGQFMHGAYIFILWLIILNMAGETG